MFQKSRIYLDWAAAAPLCGAAIAAYRKASAAFGNPSSPHEEGRAARQVLEDARMHIARLLEAKPDAVIFTSGATEANALAIVGYIEARIKAGTAPENLHVLYLPSAHASTRGAIEMLSARGVACEALQVSDGKLDLTALKAQIRPETALVALEAVCGETGTRFPVRDVRRVLDEARKGGSRVILHVDAAQLPLVESIQMTRLGADTLALDAQKVGGMRGIGVLAAPRNIPIVPLMQGGGQERGIRPGTEAHALAAAFAAALEEADAGREAFSARARSAREELLTLLASAIPDLLVNGGNETAPHILNISLPGRDTDYLVALLDEAGFAVSTRSACATDEEGSRAVAAFTNDAARAASTLRISFGPATGPKDLRRFARALIRAVRFEDANAL